MVRQSYQEIGGLAGVRALRTGPAPVASAKGAAVAPPAAIGRAAPGQRLGASTYPAEVVFVFEEFRLIDAESYQRVYSRRSGHPLVRGYYVVTWPIGRVDGRMYGDEAVFHGPYRTKAEAEHGLARVRPPL